MEIVMILEIGGDGGEWQRLEGVGGGGGGSVLKHFDCTVPAKNT